MRKLFARIPPGFWLILIAAVLRFVNLGQESLWFDEAFTARVVAPGSDMWAALAGDNHPPLWPIIQALNMRVFGDSEFAFRFWAALFSIGAVYLVYRIALDLEFMRRHAFTAGLFAAILPSSIYFGQDGRQYALLAFAVLGMVQFALRRNWYLFTPFAIAAVYSQNVGLLYVFAIGIAGLLTQNVKDIDVQYDWPKAALALAFIALAWAPWASTVISQTASVGEFFWLPPLSLPGIAWPLAMDTFGWRLPDALQLNVYAVAFGWSLVGLGVMYKYLWSSPRDTDIGRAYMQSDRAIFLAALIGAPALLALVSLAWHNIYVYRALLPSALLLMIPWAAAWHHLGQGNRRVLRILGSTALIISLIAHYSPAQGRENIPALLAPISAQPMKLAAYYLDATSAIVFGRYYPPGMFAAVRPENGNIVTVKPETRRAMGLVECNLDCLQAKGITQFYLFFVESPFTTTDCWREFVRVMERANHADLIRRQDQGDAIITYIYKVRL